ncbi:MAG: hypothetical protein JXB06_07190 [Spirochaetales bacterium]|nr:hypothetical protein [Spirochaetales bacterium]
MARILIAHREKCIRQTLALLLENQGYTTEQVEEGRAALLRILELKNSAHPFDLLVVDVDIDYLRIKRLLQELVHRGVPLPTIIITGLFSGETFEEIRAQMPIEVLNTPFEDRQIERSISGLLSRG